MHAWLPSFHSFPYIGLRAVFITSSHRNLAKSERCGPIQPTGATVAKHVAALTKGQRRKRNPSSWRRGVGGTYFLPVTSFLCPGRRFCPPSVVSLDPVTALLSDVLIGSVGTQLLLFAKLRFLFFSSSTPSMPVRPARGRCFLGDSRDVRCDGRVTRDTPRRRRWSGGTRHVAHKRVEIDSPFRPLYFLFFSFFFID